MTQKIDQDLPGEEWRSLAPEFPNHEISNYGRVRNINDRGNPLTGTMLGAYRAVRIKNHQKIPKTRPIHRLVALAFISNPKNNPVVSHVDGDRTNNHVSNLRWASHLENAAHRLVHGNTVVGERNNKTKLTREQVLEIRERWARGERNIRALAREYGVTPQPITKLINRETWKHI